MNAPKHDPYGNLRAYPAVRRNLLREAVASDGPVRSPAHDLQLALAETLLEINPQPIATNVVMLAAALGFSVLCCGVFWFDIGYLIYRATQP